MGATLVLDLGGEAPELARSGGAEISGVRPASAAERAGLHAGDHLVAVDGVVPRDLIDLRFQSLGPAAVTVDVVRDGALIHARLTLNGEEDLGLEFAEPTFDGLRKCNNNCEFCFIRGVPKGLRRSLYVRDDDYRYSFLFGNFITLTNMADDDWHRIAYQRLSPLRVSVHATDPGIRARMLANPDAPPIVPQLRRLGQVGVTAHAQIVLCPGLNDGEVLQRTVHDLASVHEAVESVAVVPVGISAHLRTREIRPVTEREADEALRFLLRANRRFRRSLGRGFVYPSDELFLLAGRTLPGERFYDGYPQLQNGVGLTRAMLADWRRHRHQLPVGLRRARRVAWLCGRAAEPALSAMAQDANGVSNLVVEVKPVDNTLFGSAISVSGLMSGRDAVRVLRETVVDLAVLPRGAFGFEGERTLDEWTAESIANAGGIPIRLARTAGELIEATVG